jgi:hypothetical protein
MRKRQPEMKSRSGAAKAASQDRQAQMFRDLLAAEELLQSSIQALVALGAGEFTSGLSVERHRLLAKLGALQGDVYSVFDGAAGSTASH